MQAQNFYPHQQHFIDEIDNIQVPHKPSSTRAKAKP